MCFTMCNTSWCMMVWYVAVQVFQCSQCRRHYPSKELLQNHMNEHVNHYKCPICGKTFPWPSSLNVHIRYRHLDNKPFKCTYCDYRWVEDLFLSQWVTVLIGSDGNIPVFHLRGAWFQSHLGYQLLWLTFSWFSRPSKKMLWCTSNWAISLRRHCSLIILLFDSTKSDIFTALLNKI
jgi:DNA-directed RNA polymerase subunit RPC12/RpoP